VGLFGTILDIRKGERTRTLLMFLYFFIIIASYWFLKPARSALTVENLSADPIPKLRLVSALLLSLVVIGYSMLVTRFNRERLAYLIIGAFFWLIAFFAFAFRYFDGSPLLYYSFYVFLDLFITINVALFWTFLADISDSESAHRLYGIIGAGGVMGGFFGSFTNRSIEAITGPGTMMLMVLGVYGLLFFVIWGVSRRLGSDVRDQRPIVEARQSRFAEAIEGARTVFRSPYFLAICFMLASYEFISTVNDFCFHKAVDLVLPKDELGGFFSGFFLIMNVVAMAVQLILTPLILKRLGITAALLVLPVLLLILSTGFFIIPMLISVEVLYLVDNATNYSINQTSRELLFVPVPRKDKYKALAFIDMFVLRTAKAAAGLAMISLQAFFVIHSIEDLRWYMLMTVTLAVVWIGLAIYLGRRYRQINEGDSGAVLR
jgi:ATP:ADP antiporter, AAA family